MRSLLGLQPRCSIRVTPGLRLLIPGFLGKDEMDQDKSKGTIENLHNRRTRTEAI